MSSKETARMWQTSTTTGDSLLVLLVIADAANDDGLAVNLSIGHIAERIRSTERTVTRILNRLAKTGKLIVRHSAGYLSKYLIIEGMADGGVDRARQLDEKGAKRRGRPRKNILPALAVEENPTVTPDNLSGVDSPPVPPPSPTPPSPPIIPPIATHPTGESAQPEIAPENGALQGKKADNGTAKLTEHPAIQAYRDVVHFYPVEAWRKEIVETVGDEPAALEKWHKIVREWLGKGYSPRNVVGMLNVFRYGWDKKPYSGPASRGSVSASNVHVKPSQEMIDAVKRGLEAQRQAEERGNGENDHH
jgi:hypothetical protein